MSLPIERNCNYDFSFRFTTGLKLMSPDLWLTITDLQTGDCRYESDQTCLQHFRVRDRRSWRCCYSQCADRSSFQAERLMQGVFAMFGIYSGVLLLVVKTKWRSKKCSGEGWRPKPGRVAVHSGFILVHPLGGELQILWKKEVEQDPQPAVCVLLLTLDSH